jgi:ligand-binding SRPBCC domain-containing protein
MIAEKEGIIKTMQIYTLANVQQVPISLQKAWEFFSTPLNLGELTPDSLDFKITHGGDTDIFPGMIIRYTLRPFPFARMSWVSEITHVEPLKYFVDEQRFGPYRFWHHLHRFVEVEGGVEIHDLVHYAMPFGFAGYMSHPILVRPQLDQIFAYRRKALLHRFGPMPST